MSRFEGASFGAPASLLMLLPGHLLAAGGPAPIEIERAFHRDGQTFLVWREDDSLRGERYRVYRSEREFGAADLAAMEPIAVVREGSAELEPYKRLPANMDDSDLGTMARYCIDPAQETEAFRPSRSLPCLVANARAPEIEAGRGLLVWTPGEADWSAPRDAWYGVMLDGAPPDAIATAKVAAETADPPKPILVYSHRERATREAPEAASRLYLHFMDRRGWNDSFAGYGFFYMATHRSTTEQKLPVAMLLHHFGARSWVYDNFTRGGSPIDEMLGPNPHLLVMPDDGYNAFWYGWEATHDYSGMTLPPADGSLGYRRNPAFAPPAAGTVVNFAEMRLLRMLAEVRDNPALRADMDRVQALGFSMGGSGAMSLALRYPQVFSAAAAQNPPSDLAALRTVPDSPHLPAVRPIDALAEIAIPRWGEPAAGLTVENRLPWYGRDGLGFGEIGLAQHDGAPAYAWMDLAQQAQLLKSPALVMLSHTYQDDVCHYPTQFLPLFAALRDARTPFSALADDGVHMGVRGAWSPAAFAWRAVPGDAYRTARTGLPAAMCAPVPYIEPEECMTAFAMPAREPLAAIRFTDDASPPAAIPAPGKHSQPKPVEDRLRSKSKTLDPAVLEAAAKRTLTSNWRGWNLDVLWAAPWQADERYRGDATDTADEFAMKFFVVPRDVDNNQTLDLPGTARGASITPRRLANFRPHPGTELVWQSLRPDGEVERAGHVSVDRDGLFTIPGAELRPGAQAGCGPDGFGAEGFVITPDGRTLRVRRKAAP